MGLGASADTAAGAAARGDLVVVTIPMRAIADVYRWSHWPARSSSTRDNYYPARDGQVAELDDRTETSSGLLQRHLPTSQVVKAFNHVQDTPARSDGSPAGARDRRALTLFGDDPEARATVAAAAPTTARLQDPVDGGPLAEQLARIEPGSPWLRPPASDADGMRQRWPPPPAEPGFRHRCHRAQGGCRHRPVEIVSPSGSVPQ